MQKREQLYEGKAKRVYATDDPNVVIVSYKDDATAFDGLKKGIIEGKGAVNNRMTNYFMKKLAERGIPTHYVQELNDRETAVKKVRIVPLEVIVRNLSAGHFASRYGVEEGLVFDEPIVEFSYKNDDLVEAGHAGRNRADQNVCPPRERGAEGPFVGCRRDSGRFQAGVWENSGWDFGSGRRDQPGYLPILGQQDR